MTRWTTGITTAVAIAITGCAVASAQTTPNQTPANGSLAAQATSASPADSQATASQATPAPNAPPGKSRLDGFGDRIDITTIPAGALWVRSGKTSAQPSFQSYVPGAAVGVKLSQYIAVEGEAAWGIGSRQELKFDGSRDGFFKTPLLFGYSASVLVNAVPSDRMVVPYGVAGIGGMHLSSREELGILNSSNFFIGEVGAGVKVMFGKWGVRGDYRFLSLRAQEEDTSFVGPQTRFGNRIYAGVVVAPGRHSSSD
jgi:hypothetical protein